MRTGVVKCEASGVRVPVLEGTRSIGTCPLCGPDRRFSVGGIVRAADGRRVGRLATHKRWHVLTSDEVVLRLFKATTPPAVTL